MRRPMLARSILALVALVTALAVVTAAAGSDELSEQPGALVTDAELCAFRAPLALTGAGELPAICAETVAWLQRVAAHDPVCYERWLESGAIPACALPYRSAAPPSVQKA